MRPSSNALSLQPLSRILRSARYVFGTLFVLTAVLLTWQYYGMEKTVELVDGRYPLAVDDDRTSGGASVGSIERHGRETILRCKIVPKYQYPYCKLIATFQTVRDGLDMSGFSYLTFDIGYQGGGPAKLNILVANAEDGLTRLDSWESFKLNEVAFIDIPKSGNMTVPLKWFSVPQWWKDMVHPPMDHSYVRMDNAARIELQNAVGIVQGEHVYTIRSVRLHGKVISQSRLLMILVAAWILCAVSFPILTTLMLRRQLKDSDTALSLLTQVNRALELEARELAGQAHIDPLTGVLNRQGLRAALINTSALLAEPMSVIFIDIDHFKNINDNHGHDVGDEVLRKFAHVIGSGIRSSDRLVRWGGEEFLIICPVTDVHQAAMVAETLRTSLHRHGWPAGLAVTASFGVAQHADNEDIGVVIKRADSELYGAKTSGRDRVHAYGVDKPAPGGDKPLQLAQVA